MESHGIVKGFDVDVVEHAQSSVFQIVVRHLAGPLVFELREESFHNCVVVAAVSAALDAQPAERLLIGLAGVLAAAI